MTLDSVCDVFTKGGFAMLKRDAPPEFAARLDDLTASDRDDDVAHSGYAGLRFRLRAIAEGKFSDVLRRLPALDWTEVSNRAGVTYIGLPTTAAAEDVELFGRVVIQDLKLLCARRLRASGNSVSVINVSANAVTATISVGNGPCNFIDCLAFSPDGSRVYVPNYTDGTLSVISTASNAVLQTVALPGIGGGGPGNGDGPEGVIVSPNGSTVYVADWGNGSGSPNWITEVNTSTWAAANQTVDYNPVDFAQR